MSFLVINTIMNLAHRRTNCDEITNVKSEMLEESMGRAEVAANSGNEKERLSQTIEELIGSVGT